MLKLLLLAAAVTTLISSPQDSALELIRRSDRLMRGDTMQGTYTMRVVHPDWQREMTFSFASEGTEKTFIRVLAPARDRGVRFLKVGNEMWQYIPRVNRAIKIPPSMMLQSWMGSDFTNDDLVKESSLVTDYTHAVLGREQEAGFDAVKLELVPKPSAAVVWGRIEYWVRAADAIPLRADFFNESGSRLRQIVYSNIRRLHDRTIPSKFTLTVDNKPGRRTELELDDAKFDIKIPRSTFTQQNLRRRS